jgi:hypothetical protein
MKKNQEDFGKALVLKNFGSAWDIANHWWYGTPRMRRAVLYEMLQTILENQKKVAVE